MLQKRIDDQPTISPENMRGAEDIFLRHLKRVGLKQAGQRNAIPRTFLEACAHLLIDEWHRLVKKTDPRIVQIYGVGEECRHQACRKHRIV